MIGAPAPHYQPSLLPKGRVMALQTDRGLQPSPPEALDDVLRDLKMDRRTLEVSSVAPCLLLQMQTGALGELQYAGGISSLAGGCLLFCQQLSTAWHPSFGHPHCRFCHTLSMRDAPLVQSGSSSTLYNMCHAALYALAGVD